MKYRQNYFKKPYYTSKRSYSKGAYLKSQWWRKKNAKYAVRNAQKNIVHVTKGVIAQSVMVPLKVSGIFEIDVDNTGHTAYNETDFIAKANCLVAPSGFFGQQPTGFDQWSSMYQRFTVLASAITCRLANVTPQGNNGATTLTQPLITVTVLPTAMTLTQLRNAADHGGTLGTGSQCDLQNDQKAKTAFLGLSVACNTSVIKHYVKLKDLYPQKDLEDEDDFSGYTVAQNGGPADPAIQAAWGVCVQSNIQSTGTNAGQFPKVQFNVTITYYTKFSSPVNLYDS